MSKAQNPLTGQMAGSMGNFVTTRLGDKNIIRAKAFMPHDAKTEAQKKHRFGFRMTVDLYPVFSGILAEGFSQRSRTTTAYLAFMKANIPGAIDKSGEVAVIDFSKLIIADGTLPKLSVKSATLDATGVTLTYLPMINNQSNSPTDVVVAMVLLKTDELWIERQARGSETLDTVFIPVTDVTAEDVQAIYLFVKNADGSKTSNSVYVALSL